MLEGRCHPARWPIVITPSGTFTSLEFMETFAEYPVLRLRIDPGEAYIAPTDDIVHDGSTFDMQAANPVDLVLCAMGYFEPGLACQDPTSPSPAARSTSDTTVVPTDAASKY